MTEPPLPSFTLEIRPFQAVTPKPDHPPGFTHEMYVQWLSEDGHVDFEAKCDAGKMWFWAARIVQHAGDTHQNTEVHGTPFDISYGSSAAELRQFTKEALKILMDHAKKTIGEDQEPRIILS